MSDPPSYDDDLLSRLNALRKSSIQLDSSKPKPIFENTTKQATPESDLSSRLRSLRNSSLSPSPAPTSKPQQSTRPTPAPIASLNQTDQNDPLRSTADLDDKTLDDLLADLGPEYQWKPNIDDQDDIQKLLDEAKNALPRDDEKAVSITKEGRRDMAKGKGKEGKEYLTRDLDMSAFALDDEDGKTDDAKHSRLQDESREVQDIVDKLMDEYNLETQNQSEAHEEAMGPSEDHEEEGEELSLPSAPSKLPEPPKSENDASRKSIDFESDIAARMAALRGLGATNELGLPSAPTFKPIDKPVKGVTKKFTDAEIETWCIICQDDATIECIGCDGDLYCAKCWKEGHMGPDVGYEERMHQWTKYRKPN